MFNEKAMEYSVKQGKEIPVWQSPKYLESKEKAIEIIDSKKYDLTEGDFWILMNETKTGKMAYNGLIISHNGCLKINDKLEKEEKFKPSCVRRYEDGYENSLIYEYSNDEQGIFEVGEVSTKNVKNSYPYAMAFKRLFDRVVLKVTKLAYAGIYSDSEADEFAKPEEEQKQPVKEKKQKAQPKKEEEKEPGLVRWRKCQQKYGTEFALQVWKENNLGQDFTESALDLLEILCEKTIKEAEVNTKSFKEKE